MWAHRVSGGGFMGKSSEWLFRYTPVGNVLSHEENFWQPRCNPSTVSRVYQCEIWKLMNMMEWKLAGVKFEATEPKESEKIFKTNMEIDTKHGVSEREREGGSEGKGKNIWKEQESGSRSKRGMEEKWNDEMKRSALRGNKARVGEMGWSESKRGAIFIRKSQVSFVVRIWTLGLDIPAF